MKTIKELIEKNNDFLLFCNEFKQSAIEDYKKLKEENKITSIKGVKRTWTEMQKEVENDGKMEYIKEKNNLTEDDLK